MIQRKDWILETFILFFCFLLSLENCSSIQLPSLSSLQLPSWSSLQLPSSHLWLPSRDFSLTSPITTVEFGQQTRKEKIILDEIIYGIFAPRSFNGTWISDDELLYRDSFGNLALMNVSAPINQEQKILVSNYTFVSVQYALLFKRFDKLLMNNSLIAFAFVTTTATVLRPEILFISR
jgi:hypothetical protein